jgi:hypothetical protein
MFADPSLLPEYVVFRGQAPRSMPGWGVSGWGAKPRADVGFCPRFCRKFLRRAPGYGEIRPHLGFGARVDVFYMEGLNMSKVVTPPLAQSASSHKIPHEKIAMRAYEKWCQRGKPQHGTAIQDWIEAENELKSEYSRSGGSTSSRY